MKAFDLRKVSRFTQVNLMLKTSICPWPLRFKTEGSIKVCRKKLQENTQFPMKNVLKAQLQTSSFKTWFSIGNMKFSWILLAFTVPITFLCLSLGFFKTNPNTLEAIFFGDAKKWKNDYKQPAEYSTPKDWSKHIEKFEQKIANANKSGQDTYDSVSYEEIKSSIEVNNPDWANTQILQLEER